MVKYIDESPFMFIGVDRYVAGYDCVSNTVSFYLFLDSNFKWFDDIVNGIAIIAETEISLIDVSSVCSFHNRFFFGDIIMGTKVGDGQIAIDFLVDDSAVINI